MQKFDLNFGGLEKRREEFIITSNALSNITVMHSTIADNIKQQFHARFDTIHVETLHVRSLQRF